MSLVYATHDFIGEQEDELSFHANDEIVILERDEQFGDGWYRGRNTLGEEGLFPKDYVRELGSEGAAAIGYVPAGSEDGQQAPTPGSARSRSTTGESSVNGLNHHQLLAVHPQRSDADASSILSKESNYAPSVNGDTTFNLDDEDTEILNESEPVDGRNLRARLAENAEKAARKDQEQRDRRRKADDEAYERERLRMQSEMPIEGLELSDESDDEEDVPVQGRGRVDSLLANNDDDDDLDLRLRRSLAEAEGVTPEEARRIEEVNARARSAISSEGDDESSHVAAAAVPLPMTPDPAAEMPTPTPGYAFPSVQSAEDEEPADQGRLSPALSRERSTSPAPPLSRVTSKDATKEVPAESPLSAYDAPPPAALAAAGTGAAMLVGGTALGAGAALVAGGAAAAAALSGKDKEEPPVSAAMSPSLSSSSSRLRKTPILDNMPLSPTIPTRVTSRDAPLDSPPAPLVANATSTEEVTDATAQRPPSQQASIISAAQSQSRSSSRLEAAPLTGGSVQTGETSPRDSAFGSKRTAHEDPAEWSVEEVLEWARSKNFDQLTMSKLQEHEITGDVLLEMDVNMLKEIDLPAFGRRVQIYKNIKELKAQSTALRSGSAGATETPSSVLSPALSGYEPDSPANSPVVYQGRLGASHLGSSTSTEATDMQRSITAPVHGLGFADEKNMQRRTSEPTLPLAIDTRTTSTHVRSVTGGTLDSFKSAEGVIDSPIPEEKEAEEKETPPQSANSERVPRPPKQHSGPFSGLKRNSIIGTASIKSRSSWYGDQAENSSPSSPATSSKPKSEKGFFSGSIARSRKPAPKVPSSLLSEKSDASSEKRNTLSASTARRQKSASAASGNDGRRKTRLFAAFSGSDKSDSESRRAARPMIRHPSQNTNGDGTSPMSPKEVGEVPSEMKTDKTAVNMAGEDPVSQIGKPDFSGWMNKRGERAGWKARFFLLKGMYLYYLKSESERKIKGFIKLQGCRLYADAGVRAGEYGFKLVDASNDRTHYFSSPEQMTTRTWMKALMKATIERDYTVSVVSSCHIDTIPLAVAQAMFPPPRPPSPTSRARVQKERYAGVSPHSLSAKDAEILMNAPGGLTSAPSSPNLNSPPMGDRRRSSAGWGSSSTSTQAPPILGQLMPKSSMRKPAKTPPEAVTPPVSKKPEVPAVVEAPTAVAAAPALSAKEEALLPWINWNLPSEVEPATDFSSSLRSGKRLVRITEKLSTMDSGITDTEFDSFQALENGLYDMGYFDTAFKVFDFFEANGIDLTDISMHDVLSGDAGKLVELTKRLKDKFDA